MGKFGQNSPKQFQGCFILKHNPVNLEKPNSSHGGQRKATNQNLGPPNPTEDRIISASQVLRARGEVGHKNRKTFWIITILRIIGPEYPNSKTALKQGWMALKPLTQQHLYFFTLFVDFHTL